MSKHDEHISKLDSLLTVIPADLARQIREAVNVHDEQVARAVVEACAKACEKIAYHMLKFPVLYTVDQVATASKCADEIHALLIADLVAALPKEEKHDEILTNK